MRARLGLHDTRGPWRCNSDAPEIQTRLKKVRTRVAASASARCTSPAPRGPHTLQITERCSPRSARPPSSGVDASVVDVEVDVAFGLPSFAVVGLPDSAVRESRDRVRSAIRHGGFEFPPHRVTVNLAPADTRKSGTAFDLPIAIGVLAAAGLMARECLDGLLIVGGLSLDGRVQRVRGILPVALLAARRDAWLVLPDVNVAESAVVDAVSLVAAHDLGQFVAHLASGSAVSRASARVGLNLSLRLSPSLRTTRPTSPTSAGNGWLDAPWRSLRPDATISCSSVPRVRARRCWHAVSPESCRHRAWRKCWHRPPFTRSPDCWTPHRVSCPPARFALPITRCQRSPSSAAARNHVPAR